MQLRFHKSFLFFSSLIFWPLLCHHPDALRLISFKHNGSSQCFADDLHIYIQMQINSAYVLCCFRASGVSSRSNGLLSG